MHQPENKGFDKVARFLQSQQFAASYFARARERGATNEK
jgi:hypothetical protein